MTAHTLQGAQNYEVTHEGLVMGTGLSGYGMIHDPQPQTIGRSDLVVMARTKSSV